jgi:hypothetical protein
MQAMEVKASRHPTAVGHVGRQVVSFNYRHPVVGVGKNAGGQQAGHARAQHDGVVKLRFSS